MIAIISKNLIQKLIKPKNTTTISLSLALEWISQQLKNRRILKLLKN